MPIAVKKTAVAKKKAISRPAAVQKKTISIRSTSMTPAGGIVRLSDPSMKTKVAQTMKAITKDRATALKFLQEMGMATPTGRLTKRYGG